MIWFAFPNYNTHKNRNLIAVIQNGDGLLSGPGRSRLQPSHLILRCYTKMLFEKLRTDHLIDVYWENIKNLFYFLTVFESAVKHIWWSNMHFASHFLTYFAIMAIHSLADVARKDNWVPFYLLYAIYLYVQSSFKTDPGLYSCSIWNPDPATGSAAMDFY